MPVSDKDSKTGNCDPCAIFLDYSRGAETGRDEWLFNFDRASLTRNVRVLSETYNHERLRWHARADSKANLDAFLTYDEKRIKWTSSLKQSLEAGVAASVSPEEIVESLYRPFTKSLLYFATPFVHRQGRLPWIFPRGNHVGNAALAITCHSQVPFSTIAADCIPALDVGGRPTQCFPFYTYDEDGTNRRENVTDWALSEFRSHYNDRSITKWQIFYYTYALLHHPEYRERYAANLKRELPRIPYAPDFKSSAEAGEKLAELHINYEKQPQFALNEIENPKEKPTYHVEKMRLSKDKSTLFYNDFLTLTGIPAEAFEYRLGNRSALEWIIDQYQVSTDKRSGIVNDPNRDDDEQYILRLIGQVIHVSLETMKLVKSLTTLGLEAKALAAEK